VRKQSCAFRVQYGEEDNSHTFTGMEFHSNRESMKYEIDKAIEELNEAYEFLEAIAELTPEEMLEKVEERDKSFIEHIEIMEEPPKSASDFWEGFSIWTISRIGRKYHQIWHKVLDSWFKSDIRKKSQNSAKLKSAVRANIEQILSDAHFE
jgi:hypothetical protein